MAAERAVAAEAVGETEQTFTATGQPEKMPRKTQPKEPRPRASEVTCTCDGLSPGVESVRESAGGAGDIFRFGERDGKGSGKLECACARVGMVWLVVLLLVVVVVLLGLCCVPGVG